MLNKDKIKRTIQNSINPLENTKEIPLEDPVVIKEEPKAENIVSLSGDMADFSIMKDCIICQEPKLNFKDEATICPECLAVLRKIVKENR